MTLNLLSQINMLFSLTKLNVRPMAHDPSSPNKFLVPETDTSNSAPVPRVVVPDFSGTRNLGAVGQGSVRHQKLGCTWLKCSAAIGRRDLHAHDASYTQSNFRKYIRVTYLSINNYCVIFMLINSDGLPWLESHFNAGPAAFWPSKQADEIGDAMFLVPVSRVWCAQLGHKFLVTGFWYQKLGRWTWVVCHPPISCTHR